jgi:long-chain fatty acid transport protein
MLASQPVLSARHRLLARAALCVGALGPGPAAAGGIILYEVGTADVGLASAGYNARAQDASTVLTNPAGMTRLEGAQLLLGAQLLYGDLKFSIGPGTSPQLGTNDGGNPVGWFPGGGAFFSYSVSPDLKLGFAMTGNFGLAEKYDSGWVGRYYVQETTLLGVSFLPSIAYRVNNQLSLGASLNIMYGKLENQVAINNIGGAPDGQLNLDDNTWGLGVNLGVLYELDPRTRLGLTYNSQVSLDFKGPAQFTGLSPALNTVLGNRGLLNANVDLGIRVPQGVMGSVFHQANDRWAVLGSVGWQQWSKFGKAEVGVDSSNPRSLTTNLDYKDTWHVAVGAQHRLSDPWMLNFGIAYDSGFQDSGSVSPMLPVNSAWRFGVGGQNQVSKTFSWGVAGEYAYGGTLDVNKQGTAPVALGGRGNLVGSYNNTGIFFIAANFNWKF